MNYHSQDPTAQHNPADGGHGGTVVEFLAWGILAMEAMVNLNTVKVRQPELDASFTFSER